MVQPAILVTAITKMKIKCGRDGGGCFVDLGVIDSERSSKFQPPCHLGFVCTKQLTKDQINMKKVIKIIDCYQGT